MNIFHSQVASALLYSHRETDEYKTDEKWKLYCKETLLGSAGL